MFELISSVTCRLLHISSRAFRPTIGIVRKFCVSFHVQLVEVTTMYRQRSLPAFSGPFHPLSPYRAIKFRRNTRHRFRLLIVRMNRAIRHILSRLFRVIRVQFPVASLVGRRGRRRIPIR